MYTMYTMHNKGTERELWDKGEEFHWICYWMQQNQQGKSPWLLAYQDDMITHPPSLLFLPLPLHATNTCSVCSWARFVLPLTWSRNKATTFSQTKPALLWWGDTVSGVFLTRSLHTCVTHIRNPSCPPSTLLPSFSHCPFLLPSQSTQGMFEVLLSYKRNSD